MWPPSSHLIYCYVNGSHIVSTDSCEGEKPMLPSTSEDYSLIESKQPWHSLGSPGSHS